MARPIIDVPILRGKAAKAFLNAMKQPRADIQQRVREAREARSRMKPRVDVGEA